MGTKWTNKRKDRVVSKFKGFTLIELIIVIVILGILSIIAAPKFIDISSDAKIAVLNNISEQIQTTNKLIQAKAIMAGLVSTDTNPYSGQSAYIVDFQFGQVEVHFSSLCAESQGELGTAMDFIDFMDISLDGKLDYRADNQYTLIGYEIPDSGVPTDEGCYVFYNSYSKSCAVTVVTPSC